MHYLVYPCLSPTFREDVECDVEHISCVDSVLCDSKLRELLVLQVGSQTYLLKSCEFFVSRILPVFLILIVLFTVTFSCDKVILEALSINEIFVIFSFSLLVG